MGKKCEFCGGVMQAKIRSKRFCNELCQRRDYNNRPEIKKRQQEYAVGYNQRNYVKEKNRIRLKKYRQRPEIKERNRVMAITRYREKRREFWKDYGKRPEVRARIREKEKSRRHTDFEYAIADRLRRSLNHAMKKYSKTGKIISSKKYGINWEEVIEHLKPFPKKIKDFEIDHITPLHVFDLNKHEEVKKAFAPENLQWLTISENRRKSGKIISGRDILSSKNLESWQLIANSGG
ncbi:MAG: hypothetical protein ABH840_03960 [Nanoarchaeota archaeon]